MKSWFIADDTFILHGLISVAEKICQRAIFINVNDDMAAVQPASGDRVILAIHNVETRRALLRIPQLKHCQLIFMLDISFECADYTYMPCFFPKSISLKNLQKQLSLLERATEEGRETDLNADNTLVIS